MLYLRLEKAMAPHSRTLAWKIPWMEEPGGLQSMGSLRVRHDFTFTFYFHALEKEMATHSSVLARRIPGMGEPDGLLSLGSHRVRHNWSDLAAAAAYLRLGLPQWLRGKESTCNAGATGNVIPGPGRSPGGGHGNPLHYSCLENPRDSRAWWATVHRVTRSRIQLKWLSRHAYLRFNPMLVWFFMLIFHDYTYRIFSNQMRP